MQKFGYRQIVSSVHPLEYVELEALPIHHYNDVVFTDCPMCRKGTLWVRSEGFLCVHMDCPLLGCSVLDLAVQRAGSRTEVAMDNLRQLFPARAEHWSGRLSDLDACCRGLRGMMDVLGRSAVTWETDTSLDGWLERFGLIRTFARRFVFPLKEEPLREWFRHCREVYGMKKVPGAERGLIIPHFTSSYEVAGFHLLDPKTKKISWFQLQDVDLCWAGWLTQPPSRHPLYVAPSASVALEMRQTLQLKGKPEGVVVCTYRPKASTRSGLPSSKLVFAVDSAKSPLTLPSRLAHRCDLRVAPLGTVDPNFDHWLSWPSFVRQGVQRRLAKDGAMGVEAIDFLQRCRPSREHLEEVQDWFRNHHRMDLAAQIDAHCSSIPICQAKDGEIIQKGSHYALLDSKTSHAEPLTNFLLYPEGVVSFPKAREVYYQFTMQVEGLSAFQVLCGQGEMLNVNTLETRLQGRVVAEDGKEGSRAVPFISNKLLFRPISEHLMKLCARKGERAGADYFGWAWSREVFRTPGWFISKDRGLVEEEFPIHPDIGMTGVYGVCHISPKPPEVLPEELNEILAMIFGSIVRIFEGVETKPVMLQEGVHSRQLLERLFSVFGQVRPHQSAESIERAASSCPSYGLGIQPTALARAAFPVFSLGSSGRPMQRTWSDHQLEVATAMLHDGSRRIIERLLIEDEPPPRQKRFVYTSELVDEGARWARLVFGTKVWKTGGEPFRTLEGALARHSGETVSSTMDYHFPSRCVRVNTTKLHPEAPREVLQDLLSIYPGSPVEGGIVSVEGIRIQPALFRYYDSALRLQTVE